MSVYVCACSQMILGYRTEIIESFLDRRMHDATCLRWPPSPCFSCGIGAGRTLRLSSLDGQSAGESSSASRRIALSSPARSREAPRFWRCGRRLALPLLDFVLCFWTNNDSVRFYTAVRDDAHPRQCHGRQCHGCQDTSSVD